jgi:RHS repeat-associated protein
LYDGENSVKEIIGSNTANSLMGGIDEVFLRTDSSGARSFLTDALGSTIALTDSSAAFQTTYSFDAFGNTSLTGYSTTNSFAYTGRELDATGLYYYRARYYFPIIQRFLSEDPVRFESGINFYRYVGNSPVNSVDPSGEIIGVSPGSGDSGYLAFLTAMLYLSQSPYGNQIIQGLQQSPKLYLVHVSDWYDIDSRSGDNVRWNPHLGGCTKRGGGGGGGGPESPALLLEHELIHLWETQNGLNSSDEEATTQISNQVAIQLGESTRLNYGDSLYNPRPWPLPIPSGRNCGCQ